MILTTSLLRQALLSTIYREETGQEINKTLACGQKSGRLRRKDLKTVHLIPEPRIFPYVNKIMPGFIKSQE